jgi:FkbM family methyltransferase
MNISKAASDFCGVVRVCGIAVAIKWASMILLHLSEIIREKNLMSADKAMGSGPFTVSYRHLRFQVCGTQSFSSIREMYVRDVYFHNGWLDIPQGSTVIDLGANIGGFTILALAFHPSIMVIAVEPSHCLNCAFHRNIELNTAPNRVRLVRAFIGEATKVQAECQADPSYAGAVFISEDELIQSNGISKIDFLKCDIEGSEFGLLLPSSKLLAMTQRIAIEVHAFAGNPKDFIQMLSDAGFMIGPVKWDPGGSCILLAKRPGCELIPALGAK